ncbi:MAG: hypothetical protein HQL76_09455 [Magnetococcales bacterium]|nr:hypothetical protein [Magnetococcales bacterium]
MKGSLESPETQEMTPEYVMGLGKEWFKFMVEATPEEELFSLPKFEHRLVQEHREGLREGLREGEMRTLLRIIQCRFGTSVPDWVQTRLLQADLKTLERWTENIVKAKNFDDIFQ